MRAASSPTPMARGGSRAKDSPLAARPLGCSPPMKETEEESGGGVNISFFREVHDCFQDF